MEREKASEIKGCGFGHPEDGSPGKGLWQLRPQAGSPGPASGLQPGSWAPAPLKRASVSLLSVCTAAGPPLHLLVPGPKALHGCEPGRTAGLRSGGSSRGAPLSLGNSRNLKRRRHGRRSEWDSVWQSGGEREGPRAWRGPLTTRGDAPFKGNRGWKSGRGTSIGQCTGRLVSETLRKPFPASKGSWSCSLELGKGSRSYSSWRSSCWGVVLGVAVEADNSLPKPPRKETEVSPPPKGAESSQHPVGGATWVPFLQTGK